MLTLDEIAQIVEIFGIAAIISVIVFGLIQLKQHRKQRRDDSIIEMARSFEDSEFTEAYRLISSLKENISLAEIEKLGEDYENAALRIGMKFETIGLLIFKDSIPIDAMEDLVGDAALTLWRILNVWVTDMRVERSHDTFLEWYQWLIEQLKKRERVRREPAYIAYKDWRPPRKS